MSEWEIRCSVWLVWYRDYFCGAYADKPSAVAAREDDLVAKRQRSRGDYYIYEHQVRALAPGGAETRSPR